MKQAVAVCCSFRSSKTVNTQTTALGTLALLLAHINSVAEE